MKHEDPFPLTLPELVELAKRGAPAAIAEHEAAIAKIREQFPSLRKAEETLEKMREKYPQPAARSNPPRRQHHMKSVGSRKATSDRLTAWYRTAAGKAHKRKLSRLAKQRAKAKNKKK